MKNAITYINQLVILAAVLGIGILSSCEREYDTPPERILPVGDVLTLKQLRNLYVNGPVRFGGDSSVYAVVSADESSGNLYRNIYVQDDSAAINLRLQNPGGLYEGDSIRIYLPGTVLSVYQGMMQLDSVDVDKNIIKQATNVSVEPMDVTVAEITPELQARLIRVNDVEFALASLCQPYADAVNQNSEDRILTNCLNQTVILRTSGFANFADQTVPSGHGSIVAVAGQFGDNMQLYIRDTEDVNLDGDRCTQGVSCEGTYFFKKFNDGSITSGGWQNYVVLSTPGSHSWETSSAGSGNPDDIYAAASGFDGGDNDSDTELWLISPSVDLSNAEAPVLSFMNAKSYSGPALRLLVSSDYDGTSDPSLQGTWTDYTSQVSWSIGNFFWSNSGPIVLDNYVGENNVHVAFKYTSNSISGAATWELDVILLDEQQ